MSAADSVRACLGAQRGAALPLTLLSLLILSVLIVAFSMLAATEPTIAGNHLMTAQARALAEAGVERALWALGNPAAPGGLPDPLPAAVPAPYDGSHLVPVSAGATPIGGFQVTVASGASAAEREITAEGWAPAGGTASGRARQRIVATAVRLRFPDPPAAVSVRGRLEVTGAAQVDGSADGSCGAKAGTFSTGVTAAAAPAEIWGRDGNAVPNEAADARQNEPVAALDPHVWTPADLDALKAAARARGAYYRGAVTFDAGHPLPDGLVFVDTVTGRHADATTPEAELASVTLRGGAAADPSGVSRGWLVVNGALAVTGDVRMRGFIYVVDSLAWAGTGQLAGALMTLNIRDAAPATIHGDPAGRARIEWSCDEARTGGGRVPQTWFIKPGTYLAVAG